MHVSGTYLQERKDMKGVWQEGRGGGGGGNTANTEMKEQRRENEGDKHSQERYPHHIFQETPELWKM